MAGRRQGLPVAAVAIAAQLSTLLQVFRLKAPHAPNVRQKTHAKMAACLLLLMVPANASANLGGWEPIAVQWPSASALTSGITKVPTMKDVRRRQTTHLRGAT